MSNFLALSNTALRVRIRTSDFQDALFRYIHFDSSEKNFRMIFRLPLSLWKLLFHG